MKDERLFLTGFDDLYNKAVGELPTKYAVSEETICCQYEDRIIAVNKNYLPIIYLKDKGWCECEINAVRRVKK